VFTNREQHFREKAEFLAQLSRACGTMSDNSRHIKLYTTPGFARNLPTDVIESVTPLPSNTFDILGGGRSMQLSYGSMSAGEVNYR
jgi:hypothetical protein